MMKNRLSFVALLAAVALTLPPATAQELTTGTLAGKVSDPAGKPIAGAVIITTSQYGTRTADTDADGEYILPFLRPGTYTVRVEAPGGFNTVIQNEVVVSLNQRSVLNFTLEPGKTETVTVTGQSPLVDPTSTSSGTNLKYDDFAGAVPLGRSFTDTYAVAPGVVSGLGTGDGNYSIGGASGLENAYLVDGVNITNTGYGGIGAYNIVYGSLGTGVTSEFLDEVQIKTGGFEAEYGQAMGGIINTIVKSGTNETKGRVSWFSTPTSFEGGRDLVDFDSGSVNIVNQNTQDFGFSLGGPIVKDKLFYFVAYNPVFTRQHLRANPKTDPAFTAASNCISGSCDMAFNEANPEAFAAPNAQAFPSAGQDIERKRTANNYAAKISWVVSPKHQMEFTMFGDPAEGDEGLQRGSSLLQSDFAAGGGQSNIKYGSHNQSIKWSAVFGPRFFMEAQLAHHDGKFRETSVLNEHQYTDLRNLLEFFRDADSYTPDDVTTVPLALSPVTTGRGGLGFISNQDDENLHYSLKFTNIVGNHELRYGVQYDDIEYRETPSYTGPSFDIELPVTDPTTGAPVDADLDGFQDTVPVPTVGGATIQVRNGLGADPTVAYDDANRFRVTRARVGPELPPVSATDVNLFVQDTWQVHPRLTVKAGLRYTREELQGAGSFTLPFATQNVMFGPVTARIYGPGTSSYTPSSHTFDGNWAPRLGVSWDVLGTGRSRLFLNWGRYYERIPGLMALRAFSNEVSVARQEFTDRDLTTPRFLGFSVPCDDGGGGPTPCEPLAGTGLLGVDQTTIVEGTKLPYEDELSGGFAFEVGPSSSFEVRAIFRSQGRVLEDVQVNAVEQIQNFYYGYAYGYPYDPFGGSPGTPQSPTYPAAPFGTYEMANPGTGAVPSGGLFSFPSPKREYKALELIYTKRYSDNWSLYANYRFARLKGNYEGLFRNDNLQSDPNITSLYDFPDTPLMAGQFMKGDLPADAQHVLHVYPSYTFGNKLRLGANFTWISGTPRTSMLAHPIYLNSGEIPGIDPVYAYWVDPGGTGFPTDIRRTDDLGQALTDTDAVSGLIWLDSYTPVRRGNLGRTPDLVTFDVHADYPLQIGKSTVTFMFDVFNLFGSQSPQTFNDNIELTAGVTDPDFLKSLSFQSPRSLRMAARWDF
jgi:outer membrane receptor protein involved in Fe transport